MSARVEIPAKPVAAPARSPAPLGILQRKCAYGGLGSSGSEWLAGKKEFARLQRKSVGHGLSTVPPIVHKVLRSPGRPLDAPTRAFFEPRFGHDFSKVRVHSDAEAAESAEAVGSLAYTVGSQIVFGGEQYRPGDPVGRWLLGHELTHVVQQRGAASDEGLLRVGTAGDSHEQEADRMASCALDAQLSTGLSQTEKSAQTISTAASAVADQIVFRPGQQGPAAKAGASPLAHKLTRAVQHSRGPAVLRRKCLADIGATPSDCELIQTTAKDEPSGNRYLFNVNCDDFAPREKARLETDLADPKVTPPNSEITVLGMASAEGDSDFNDSLSCHRASAAVKVLKAKGFGNSIKTVQATGGIPGTEHNPRFRAVEIGTKAKPGPKLDFTKAKARSDACGGYLWQVAWILNGMDETTAGYVVQRVHIHNSVGDCGSGPADSEMTYWEAWEVKNQQITNLSGGAGTDTFKAEPAPRGMFGRLFEEGFAKFMPNYTAPGGWGQSVPTQAGGILSTYEPPREWSDAGALHRSITAEFNCCGGAPDDTQITTIPSSATPEQKP